MKTEKVLLPQIKVNTGNPRTITERKMALLVERLLTFPKMITLRPIVVDERMTALGGNMRLRAFEQISKMTIDEIARQLAKTKNFKRRTEAEREMLLGQWQSWLSRPTVEIVRASTLSEEEKHEFIIADNASFGAWDYDKLANEWASDDLVSWGVDVWETEKVDYGAAAVQPLERQVGSAQSAAESASISTEALPEELQGIDFSVQPLPKIEGEDETIMERIIIVYPKSRVSEVARLIGLGAIEKVIYHLDEIVSEQKGE